MVWRTAPPLVRLLGRLLFSIRVERAAVPDGPVVFAVNHFSHLDPGRHVMTALVLHRIVQKRRDGLVLVAAMLDHKRRNAHQVGDVGDAGPVLLVFSPLPSLAPVEFQG